MTQLSKNFTLDEFLESKTARTNNITEQWSPPQEVIDNLTLLCINVLQPLRDALGPISISSGYRCPRVNTLAKGVSNSQHMTGEAADCEYAGPGGNQKIWDTVLALNLPFDQMINEYNLEWVHLSFSSVNNRKETEIIK